MREELEYCDCDCGKQAEQVINAEENLRLGWWCPACNAFYRAIGRERVWIASWGLVRSLLDNDRAK